MQIHFLFEKELEDDQYIKPIPNSNINFVSDNGIKYSVSNNNCFLNIDECNFFSDHYKNIRKKKIKIVVKLFYIYNINRLLV